MRTGKKLLAIVLVVAFLTVSIGALNQALIPKNEVQKPTKTDDLAGCTLSDPSDCSETPDDNDSNSTGDTGTD